MPQTNSHVPVILLRSAARRIACRGVAVLFPYLVQSGISAGLARERDGWNPSRRLRVNWASGQEVAARVMAWGFGLHAFLESPSSTAERIFRLVRMFEKHGERIAGFIEYALSQKKSWNR